MKRTLTILELVKLFDDAEAEAVKNKKTAKEALNALKWKIIQELFP
jgi:hypothetical protein